jgi:hypothetical protein
VLDMFAGTYFWVPPQDQVEAHDGNTDDRREPEPEKKHEHAAGATAKGGEQPRAETGIHAGR